MKNRMNLRIRWVGIGSCAVLLMSMASGCGPKATPSSANEEVSEMEMTDQLFPKDEAVTFYQTGTPFIPQTSLQTDGWKLFFATPESANALVTMPATASIRRAMFSANQDVGSYYTDGRFDGKTHEDDVYRKADGSIWQFGLLPGLPYILPTNDWNAYLTQMMRDAIEAGANQVSIEEVDIFSDSGFEQAFRDAWKVYYGEDWQAPWSDPNLFFKAQKLKNHLNYQQVKTIFETIKSEYPDVSCFIADHTTLYGTTLNIHDALAMDCVDGIEGQTWSNTTEIPFRYNGSNQSVPFVSGFMGYGYWAGLAKAFPSKEVSVITDPKGDGYEQKTLEECKILYQHQLASQLAFSSVYRYNSCVWPDRSYNRSNDVALEPVSTDAYRTIMNNIISLQNKMVEYKGQKTVFANQTAKIGVVHLETSCYQFGGPQTSTNVSSFFGMVAGLLSNGIPVEPLPIGDVEAEDDILKDYDLLLVSYDTMKPMSALCNQRLQAYVENGGHIVYFGGQGDYEAIDASWWKEAGFDAPQDELFERLGVKTSGRQKKVTGQWTPVTGTAAQDIGAFQPSGMGVTGYQSIEGAEPLYKAGDVITAFRGEAGRGSFWYFGVDPLYFTDMNKGDALFNTLQKVVENDLGKTLVSAAGIQYKRGDVVGVSALKDDMVLSGGKFLSLFDETLKIADSFTVKKGFSDLYLDVTEKYQSEKPAVLFAQGNNPTIVEQSLATRIISKGPADTYGMARIFVPEGYAVGEVTAVNAAGKNAMVSQDYDADTQSLVVTYRNHIAKVTVDVSYTRQ